MALSRVQSAFTYQSSSGGETWLYDIVYDQQSLVFVRNIRGPRGLVTDTYTGVPQTVIDDIQEALVQVAVITSTSSAASGTETFDGQTTRMVSIPGGTLNNTNYMVALTSPDGTLLRVENKTTTCFDIVASTTYGAVGDAKDVDWSVLTATLQTTSFLGTLTFAFADAGSKTVTFASALPTSNYQVILTEGDFFKARVSSKTTQGFTVEIGHSLQNNGETTTVDFSVMV